MANETGNDTAESTSESESSSKDTDVFKIDIPPEKMTSDLEDYIWDIKSLNFYMEPISRPSATLDLYMKKCEQRRTIEVNKICCEINNLNEYSENCIRAAYEIMKCELKGIEAIIENWKLFVCSGEVPLTSVMMVNHKILNLTALKELLKKRKSVILEFHRDIMKIEHRRRNKGSSILQNYFKSYTKLSLQKPGEIREVLEYEILKINQSVLSNIRYYEDVKLNLLLHGQKMETSFRDYLDKCRRNFALKIMQTLREENDKINLDKYFINTEEGKTAMKSLYTAREEINKVIRKKAGQTKFTPDEVESTALIIQRAAQNLDDCAKHVISLYKKITYNVFQGHISSLEKVQQEFLHLPSGNQLPEKDTELEELEKKMFAPLFEKQERQSEHISDLEVKWTEIISEMQASLRCTFLFLRDSSKIWDRHFERTNATKHMINLKIMTLTADQTVSDLMVEKDLSIALDMLRQEPVEENHHDLLTKVFLILDSMEVIYITNNVERTKSLDKFISAMEAETKILLAEIDAFLEIYPNEFFNDYFDIHPRSLENFHTKSDHRLEESENSISLPMELQKCQYQTDALRNWKLGLREAILFYSTVCAKEMSMNTKRWVERQSRSLMRSLEAKLALHHARYHRVKTDVYCVRLAEIQYHRQRLESHLMAVRKHIGDLSLLYSEYEEKMEEDEENLRKCMEEVLEKGAQAANSMVATKLTLEANETFKIIQHMFQSSFDAFHNEITKTMEWINSSNLNYLRSLKLFSEGGNYHPSEMSVITKELDKLSNEGETHTKEVLAQAKKKHSNIHDDVVIQTSFALQSFKSQYEDLQFLEKVNFSIKRVREFIKKEVRNLKYNRKLICLKIEQLLAFIRGSGGLDLITFIEEYWENLFTMTHQHHAYLLQPNATRSKTGQSRKAKTTVGLRFKSFGVGRRPKSRKSVPAKKMESRKYLFDQKNPPLSGSSFMENICRGLWDVMVALEDVALAFYKVKRKSPVAKIHMVQPNYLMCMQDIILRFKYYHLQCEDVWLKEVKVYFGLLSRMQSVANVFAEQAIQQFHQSRMNAVTDNHNVFMDNMKKKSGIESDTLTALNEKLKPLHGYPGNKGLLAALIKEMQAVKSATSDSTRDYGVQYKGYLKDRDHFYKIDIHGLCSHIQKIMNTVFNPQFLLGGLMKQAQEVVSGRRAIAAAQGGAKKRGKSPKGKKASSPSSPNGETDDEQDNKGNPSVKKKKGATKKKKKKVRRGKRKKKDESIPVPEKYLLEIEKESPRKLTADKAVTTDGTLASDAQDLCSEPQIPTETIAPKELPVDVVAIVEDAKKDYIQHLMFCSRQSSRNINAIENDLETWKNLFMKNVEQVKNLYKSFVPKWTK